MSRGLTDDEYFQATGEIAEKALLAWNTNDQWKIEDLRKEFVRVQHSANVVGVRMSLQLDGLEMLVDCLLGAEVNMISDDSSCGSSEDSYDSDSDDCSVDSERYMCSS